jgi:hypothetical protein
MTSSPCSQLPGCCDRHPKVCARRETAPAITGRAPSRHHHHHLHHHDRHQDVVSPHVLCDSDRPRLAALLRRDLRSGDLPYARHLNQRAKGFNGTRSPLKRDWRRGARSSSLSREMQHRWMWQFVDKYHKRLRGSRCLDWDGWYGGSVFRSICKEVDVLVYAKPFGQVWSLTHPHPTRYNPNSSCSSRRPKYDRSITRGSIGLLSPALSPIDAFTLTRIRWTPSCPTVFMG